MTLDLRDNVWKERYSYRPPGFDETDETPKSDNYLVGEKDGEILFKYKWISDQNKKNYRDYLERWVYSELNDNEISPCKPPYDDKDPENFCFNILGSFQSYDDTPMVFRCYVGLLPFYCPFDNEQGLGDKTKYALDYYQRNGRHTDPYFTDVEENLDQFVRDVMNVNWHFSER